MACATAAASFAVEVFVEEDEVTPVRVVGIFISLAMARPCPILVREKYTG
jgi:hypothetical protein